MAKSTAPKNPLTKTELLANIAAATELPKTQVAAVLNALAAEIQTSLGKKGAGAITIPGLVKIENKQVPARKAEKRVPNQTHRESQGWLRVLQSVHNRNTRSTRSLNTLNASDF